MEVEELKYEVEVEEWRLKSFNSWGCGILSAPHRTVRASRTCKSGLNNAARKIEHPNLGAAESLPLLNKEFKILSLRRKGFLRSYFKLPTSNFQLGDTKPIPGNQIANNPTHLHIPRLRDLNILTAVNKTRITWLISGAWSKCAQIAQAEAGSEWKVDSTQLLPLQALATYSSTEQSVAWSKGPLSKPHSVSAKPFLPLPCSTTGKGPKSGMNNAAREIEHPFFNFNYLSSSQNQGENRVILK